jgi:hypothetical protein
MSLAGLVATSPAAAGGSSVVASRQPQRKAPIGLHFSRKLIGFLPARPSSCEIMQKQVAGSQGPIYIHYLSLTWDWPLSGKLGGPGPWTIELTWPRYPYAGTWPAIGGSLTLTGTPALSVGGAGYFTTSGTFRGTIMATLYPGPIRVAGRWTCQFGPNTTTTTIPGVAYVTTTSRP